MALPRVSPALPPASNFDRINTAIGEAEKIPAVLSVVETKAPLTETTALRTSLRRLIPPTMDRPGDAPEAFTLVAGSSQLGGDNENLPNLPAARVAFGNNGFVVRLTGPGVLGARARIAIEANRTYRIVGTVRRRGNVADPSNDTVRLGVAWLDEAGNYLSSAVVADQTALVIANGRVALSATIAALAAPGIDIVAPTDAVYARGYVQNYAATGVTDVENLRIEDISAAGILPDIAAGVADQVDTLLSQHLADRLEVIESMLDTPRTRTFDTIADAQAADIESTVTTLRILGRVTVGDVYPEAYVKVGSNPGSADGFQADAKWWKQVRPDATLTSVVVALSGTRYAGGADYVCDGTNAAAKITDACEFVSDAGGGRVLIMPGLFNAGTMGITLTGLSNVILEGCGTATILQKGSGFANYGIIVLAACTNCRVQFMYGDSNGQDGNIFVAGTEDYSSGLAAGAPSSNIHFFALEGDLQPNEHNYGIWFLNVQGGSIKNCVIDGNSNPWHEPWSQEGIECYGGQDIEVSGNLCRNLAGSAFSIVSFPDTLTPARNIHVHDNKARLTRHGVWVNPSQGALGASHFENINIHDNVFDGVVKRGFILDIDLGATTSVVGLVVKNINFHHNLFRMLSVAEGATLGGNQVLLLSATLTSDAAGSFSQFLTENILVEHNEFTGIEDVSGESMANLIGITDVTLEKNTLRRYAADNPYMYGIYAYNTKRCRILSNHLEGMTTYGILVDQACDGIEIVDNAIITYDGQGVGAAAIQFEGTSVSSGGLRVENNRCLGSGAPTVLVNLGGAHSIWRIDKNRGLSLNFTGAECGTPAGIGNRGELTASSGLTTYNIPVFGGMQDSQFHVFQSVMGSAWQTPRMLPQANAVLLNLPAANNGAKFKWKLAS
jgi:hypothetical protein